MILNSKKLRKLRINPKLFFKDAIEKRFFALDGVYKRYLPKKYKAFSKYTIISAVYNVEKYLDDYFNSIINQRLDFKNNIFMILVDDGSTDNCANIIKKYQKKYPKNIVCLYKENGGQASARNLGLKYMQENNYQTPWVTFTDPDDFLDRNYFYELDKFLLTHQDDDICMIGCNIIFYHEKEKLYKDNHPLNFKFKNGVQVRENYNLDNFIQLSAASCFINMKYFNKLIFDEKLKPNFEDAKFINEYLLENINLKSAFLSKSKYFYRKREDNSSTLDLKLKSKAYYLNVTRNGYLNLFCICQEKNDTSLFIQNLILYDLCWQIKNLINSPEKVSFMSEREKQEYLKLLDENFSYIESETIINFDLAGCWLFHKIGILNCFKKEKPPFQIAYIEDYDPYEEQILLTYYTGDDKDIESILVDGKEICIEHKKIVKYDFLDRVFCYQRRLWIRIPKEAKNKLEIFINEEQSKIFFNKKRLQNVNIQDIRKEFQKRSPKGNIWLLMDRDYQADDNAEHLYRYIMQNHLGQEIVFALRKESSDWERLKKEGFNLVEFGSFEFERVIRKASKVISSHADEYLTKYITFRSRFVFLQHGVILNDLSKWLNSKKIDLFITSTQAEYDSIVNDYSRYKFGKKEVVLTGLARHDALLENNQLHTRQILIMPTWRANLVETILNSSQIKLKNNFNKSEYFQKWNLFLNNHTLRKLSEKYSYVIVFNLHPKIMPYLKDFNIPSYIEIANKNESIQKLFCNSSLMITDYSSVAFEMAYLNKPVIYYQFDKKYFFKSHTLQKGYFDYEKDGFGPIVYEEDHLIIELKRLLNSSCILSNVKNTFRFKNNKNCQRIFNIINKMNDEKYFL